MRHEQKWLTFKMETWSKSSPLASLTYVIPLIFETLSEGVGWGWWWWGGGANGPLTALKRARVVGTSRGLDLRHIHALDTGPLDRGDAITGLRKLVK